METVDESVRAFWSQIADGLRDRISTQDWCSWFAGARIAELGAECVVIEVVNEFAVRWIDGRFRDVLESTVAEVAGMPIGVQLVARAAAPTTGSSDEPGAGRTSDGAHAPDLHYLAPAAALAARVGAHTGRDADQPLAAPPTPTLDAPQPAAPPVVQEQSPAASAPAAQVAAPGPDVAPAPAHVHRPVAAASSGRTAMTEAELRAELRQEQGLPSRSLHDLQASAVLGESPVTSPTGGRTHDTRGARIVDEPLSDSVAGVQPLNDRYRFETFVIGPGNQMVHAAALAVAEAPAQAYNPLYVHGSTGLGKTHLLHAIGHYVRETRPEARVAYITTETFLNRFMSIIQAAKTSEGRPARDRFKSYFRQVDVLLVDDVQFLSGKGPWLQEELFHIFNALHETGRQIVLTSDCRPEQILKLEDRLRSRFAWGLIADIDTPDLDTRVAILRKKAQVDGLAVPQTVFEQIAARITTNVRELEGALTRVVADASLSGRTVTEEIAARVLDSYARNTDEPVTIERIQQVVCDHFAMERDDLLSARRTATLTLPRHIAMYLSRVLVGAPSTQVAQRFNRKDHTTVLSAERKIDQMMRSDRDVHDLVARLTDTVRGAVSAQGVGAAR